MDLGPQEVVSCAHPKENLEHAVVANDKILTLLEHNPRCAFLKNINICE
jgi:hypothetical protein